MGTTISLVLIAMILASTAYTFFLRRNDRSAASAKRVIKGVLSINGAVLGLALLMSALALLNPAAVLAQTPTTTTTATSSLSGQSMGAALSTGLACIGAGIAVGIAGAAAIGGITEKPEVFGRALVFVGLAEGIAIYGLIIAVMILNK
jgi:V/A-type H+-transporting ATPase subunit K